MSANTVLLLPHQERFLQSRINFPEIRWHFLLAGYGAGKSRSLAISALEIISELDGEKDDGGLYMKMIIGGYTHAHLEQTLMIDFRAYLDASKTPYHEDTKNHIITVGTVQVIFVQLLEPGKIFGQSVYCALLDECLVGRTKVLTKQTTGDIVYKKLKDISVGDLVLTRYGWRLVIRTKNQGRRKVTARNGLTGTPDHCVAAVGGYTELQDTKGKQLYAVSKRTVKLWEKSNQALKDLEKSLSSTAESITGILLHDTAGRENILSALQTVNLYMKRFGKKQTGLNPQDVKYIIKMVTLSITLLKTLSVLQKKNTYRDTLSWELARTIAKATIRSYVIYAERLLKDIMELHLTECAQNSALLGQDLLQCVSLSLSAQTALTESSMETEVTFARTVGSLLFRVGQIVSSAAKNAETLMLGNTDLPQSSVKNLTPLPVPFVARRSRLVIRALDVVRNLVLTITDGTRTVYDITVDDCHEFATSSCFVKNCDELPEDTMIEAMKSVSQRVRQVMPSHRSPFIMAASTAQGMKGFYRLYCHYKKSGIGFVLTRARTQDNWYLPKEYILDLWKNFTPTERKVYMEGAFLSVTQGRVIPGFDWDKNFLPESDMDLELRPGERVYVGFDWNTGYNRGSAWVARNGILYCIKYYDFPDPMEAPKTFRYDFPEQDIFWIPDVTAKDRFPHYGRELRRNDIHIIFRSKSPLVEDSCFLVSKLCMQKRILITSQAREVAEAFSTASRDKDNKIPKGVGPNSPIHAIDGARYVCSYLALVLPEFRDLRRGIMSHLASFRAGAEEIEERLSAVADLGAGYSRIEGRAFSS